MHKTAGKIKFNANSYRIPTPSNLLLATSLVCMHTLCTEVCMCNQTCMWAQVRMCRLCAQVYNTLCAQVCMHLYRWYTCVRLLWLPVSCGIKSSLKGSGGIN